MVSISPRNLRILAALGFLATLSAPAVAGPVYTFDNVAPLTSGPFSDTQDGLIASFGSPAGSGGLVVEPGFFLAPFSGRALFNNGVTPNSTVPLTALFNKGLHGVSLDFATLDTGAASTFTLRAFSGGLDGKLVGTVTAVGVREQSNKIPTEGLHPNIAMFFYPQGKIGFTSDTPFDAIELSAGPGVTFAIDNVAAVVPEPAGLTLAGLTIAGLSARAWRRRITRPK